MSNLTQRGYRKKSIRTYAIKVKIDKTQQNSRSRLGGDGDETINLILSECSELAQNVYKSKHAWLGKVIHWELCMKLMFDPVNKYHMHNPESLQETETHIPFWDFDKKINHQISVRRSDFVTKKKKRKNKSKKKKT